MKPKARKRVVNQDLREQRLLCHWSQQDVADRIGTTTNNISRWELGQTHPGPYFRTRLCTLFGKSAEELGFFSERLQFPAPLFPTISAPGENLSTLSPTLPCVWGIPHPRNPFFTGREGILHQLHQLLGREKTMLLSQSWTVSGLGGIGKTQTILEYAYRHSHDYAAIFWISAETTESIISSFATIADLLNLPEKQEPKQEKMITGVTRWLSSHSDWLLLVDNVENPELVKAFLPPARRGCLLFTSRRQALGFTTHILTLAQMTPEEGMHFLLHRARLLSPIVHLDQLASADVATALKIAAAMDGLPLALDQAGAYIEASQCSLSDYLQLFQSSSLRLLGERDESTDHPLSVIKTFALAFEQLECCNPAARELLIVCAFLAPDAIPETVFLEGAPFLGPTFEAFAAHPLLFHAAFKALLTYSLLQRNPATRTVTIHRLVQAVLKGHLSEAAQRTWAARVIHVMNQLFPVEEHLQADYWQTCEQLLPHALACMTLAEQWHDNVAERTALMSHVALYLSRRIRFAEAEPLFLRAVSMGEHALGSEHPLMADVFYRLAYHYNLQGRYQEAVPLYQRALHIAERSRETEHPLLAEILTGLAGRYRELGRYQEAELLFQRALRITEDVSGPKVAFPLQGLATLYEYQGRYEEAEPLLQRALRIREQVLGPEHTQVAGLLSDLGIVYQEQGKYEEAELLLQRALRIFEQAVGPEHSYVTYPLNNLAGLLAQKGNHKEAELLYQRALTLRQQQLGPQHPAVAETLHALACLRQAQQQTAEALSLYRQALTIREQTFGADHPKTRVTRTAYACLLREMELVQDAVAREGQSS